MNTRQNNKGFSLVELIVVIAIMGILAVTLAPRLSQYVEKARVASDQEAVNTIFSAAKLAKAEFGLTNGADEALGGFVATVGDTFFTKNADGDTWTVDTTFAPATTADEEFYTAMEEILGGFTLKSSDVVPGTQITLTSDGTTGNITVTLDYSGADFLVDTDYEVVE